MLYLILGPTFSHHFIHSNQIPHMHAEHAPKFHFWTCKVLHTTFSSIQKCCFCSYYSFPPALFTTSFHSFTTDIFRRIQLGKCATMNDPTQSHPWIFLQIAFLHSKEAYTYMPAALPYMRYSDLGDCHTLEFQTNIPALHTSLFSKHQNLIDLRDHVVYNHCIFYTTVLAASKFWKKRFVYGLALLCLTIACPTAPFQNNKRTYRLPLLDT